MPTISTIDEGRNFDWGRTSSDYAEHRPGPPASFYERLYALGVGRARQRILDLGTGTGLLARQFARQGADVVGVDIAQEQIAAATRLAQEERLERALCRSAGRSHRRAGRIVRCGYRQSMLALLR